jgi:hypothetical protein
LVLHDADSELYCRQQQKHGCHAHLCNQDPPKAFA